MFTRDERIEKVKGWLDEYKAKHKGDWNFDAYPFVLGIMESILTSDSRLYKSPKQKLNEAVWVLEGFEQWKEEQRQS
ncbi:hypothetical protein [Ammoniphilus sp. YIM 78166]|uniref:hypothetical protein n=1 Tax=Ammoniphilus sp. YIM 78166 TaxID=1644106 RepID=UPI00106FA0E0|nr:hypothetical protein [Ammoniphilus sp. YIM 78166]